MRYSKNPTPTAEHDANVKRTSQFYIEMFSSVQCPTIVFPLIL